MTNLPREVEQQEPFVNHSIYSADRMTHLKIVVVAMIAGVALVASESQFVSVLTMETRDPRAS